jgi:hypothetical protein
MGGLFRFQYKSSVGEGSFIKHESFFSVNSGLVYSITSEYSNFDIGVAAFHVNTPKQTFLEDDRQSLAMRKVIHANFETILNSELVLNTNAIFQVQDQARYLFLWRRTRILFARKRRCNFQCRNLVLGKK